MSELNKNLAEIFDVTPVEHTKPTPVVIHETRNSTPATQTKLDKDLDEDYNMARNNIEEVIDTGKEAMATLMQIAADGQHPRSFEVLGQLMKTIVDANKELIAIQKQMRDMDGKQKGGKDGSTKIDKAIFIGSTQELLKSLKQEEKND